MNPSTIAREKSSSPALRRGLGESKTRGKQMRKLRRYTVLLAGLCLLLLRPAASYAAEEGKRVALIIGNDAYTIRPLRNAVNDARAMEKALQAAGFQTILRENANKVAMEEAAADFIGKIGPEDTALFYYAGHAVQVEGENLLIPVDFETGKSIVQAKFRSLPLAIVFEYLKRSRPKRTILILDACRSNPVAEGNSLAAGLANPQNEGKETY